LLNIQLLSPPNPFCRTILTILFVVSCLSPFLNVSFGPLQSRDGSDEDVPPSSTSFFGAPPTTINHAQIEREQRLLEQRLRQQQLQSEEDSRWLQQEETNLKKRLSVGTGSSSFGSAEENSDSAPEPVLASASAAIPSQQQRQAPTTPAFDRDRSATPLSSSNASTEERPIGVKVRKA
jgi:hypothetical protein